MFYVIIRKITIWRKTVPSATSFFPFNQVTSAGGSDLKKVVLRITLNVIG